MALARTEVVSGSATMVAFAVLLGPVFALWLGSKFLSTEARVFDLYASVPILILAIGITIPLACNQFDLSVGPVATLAVFLSIGLVTQQHLSLPLSIAVALLAGVTVGLLNGFLVVRLGINAFIATLGTSGVVAGLYTVYSGGRTITPDLVKGPYAPAFKAFTNFGGFQLKAPLVLTWLAIAVLIASAYAVIGDRWPPSTRRGRLVAAVFGAAALAIVGVLALTRIPQLVSWNVLVMLAVAWLVWALLRLTSHGRAFYAIGGSPIAAGLAGIAVSRYLYAAFVVSGLLAAVSGVMLAAGQGTAVPGIADGFLLPTYAAAFLSTVIVSSGRFHVWGAVVGGLLVVWVAQGLVVGGISYTWTDVINGAVLVLAVAFSTSLRRRRH